MSELAFPFGQLLRTVRQADRSAKEVFVLGVYASAVHALWRSLEGGVVVRALAVASEPEIFWTGDGAAEFVSAIGIPGEMGSLAAAAPQFNGPSGRALDALFLGPLGLSRDQTWLCDLLPQSRLNGGQVSAIASNYRAWVDRGVAPPATVPPVPRVFTDAPRRDEITQELLASGGDHPDHPWRLADSRVRGARVGPSVRTLGAGGCLRSGHRHNDRRPAVSVAATRSPQASGRLGFR